MASTVASKGAPLASLLRKLLAEPSASGSSVAYYALRPTAFAVARRPYNTDGAPLRRYDDGEESGDDSGREREVTAADDRSRARDFGVPSFFSTGVLDPFGAPTSLGRLLALMEDAAASATGTSPAAAASPWRRGWWVPKEDDDAVYLKVPMPGLGKEHVKVWAEQNSVVIKGEGEKEPGDDDDAVVPRYSRRIEVAADAFKMDQIKAEMKNGVLKVALPKVKEEERRDVFQVKVQ